MFTWVPIYQEIAAKILHFEKDQGSLLSFLTQLEQRGHLVISLKDRDSKDKEIDLAEIDPFTFYSNFNRSLRHDKRQGILSEIKKHWSLKSNVPTDFHGVPIVNNLGAWFFPYLKSRSKQDIVRLWQLARETILKKPADFNGRDHGVGPSKIRAGGGIQSILEPFLGLRRPFLAVKRRFQDSEVWTGPLQGDVAAPFFLSLKHHFLGQEKTPQVPKTPRISANSCSQ